ncbi:restriction endonuclease [Anaerotruncus rubiinfantis]|uniref:restriction endonuclease n=1 Tax=Anaerotruncus rubiinfantis TaxID=1720200 RepID=UPI0011CCD5FC|nr:restriction endonuclease [Anaerotruncus rubiinfantis]
MASSYQYFEVIRNDYLGQVKEIKAQTQWELDLKIKAQEEKWAQQETSKRERDRISDLKEEALNMNEEAESIIEDYRSILKDSLSESKVLDWKSQKDNSKYPAFSYEEKEPELSEFRTALKVPEKSFIESIFKSKKEKREALEKQAQEQYDNALQGFNTRKAEAKENWRERKKIFDDKKADHNKSIDDWKVQFEAGESDAIERYLQVVFAKSIYPEGFSGEYTIQYEPNSHTCIISMNLPNTDDVPHIVGYKYVASTKSIKPVEMKVKEFATYYDTVVKQAALRTINEAFCSDYPKNIQSVVYNGWVDGIDRATGQEFTSCIISLQVSREKFESLKLELVSVPDCIRDLKAVYAGNLSQLAPVKPIMEINREDTRFIESREVLAEMDSSTNLAIMPWEDFEHLVRELFSKYFSENGAEVKVTQSSRDGGVDAIAFDPDPIRGGKFVIQAKRYNRVVPVSAVRDLYGTMINEGAAKGILVTTSYYGNDSREFVKDKPISLIDGSNLIHMFSEYGYDLHIELQTAAQ